MQASAHQDRQEGTAKVRIKQRASGQCAADDGAGRRTLGITLTMTLNPISLLLVAIVWYVVCQIISTRLRRKIPESYGTVPTKWSMFFYALSLFGAIAIIFVALLLA